MENNKKDPTPRNKFRRWMKNITSPMKLRRLRRLSALEKLKDQPKEDLTL